MSRHQKASLFFILDYFERQRRRMGSFLWDDDFNDMCYSQQHQHHHHHHGRPLSVALTEPFDPFEPQPSSFFDDIPYIESDFASLHRHHHHHQHQHRSRSSGRRYKRECYSVHYPNVHPNRYCFSPPPPPPPRRPINRVASREVLIEKIETVTIEEPARRAPPYMVSFLRAPSPPVRQLKIRPRPSSCFDLRKESIETHQEQRENRWSKFVDEHHEEHFQYDYQFRKTPDRIVPIEREPPPPPPPRIRLYDKTTSTEDLYIPPPPPPPRPVRPEMKDTSTTTEGLPRRPLCVTETQIIERFEKTEKVRRDSTSSTEGADGGFVGKSHHRASKKSHRKDFVQRMHARNGTAMNLYTPDERRREKTRVIVRPTARPREVLVDTSGIFGMSAEFSEPSTPNTSGQISGFPSRNPFRPPDLK